jgi:SAM-dependent methyltransferase
MIPEQKNMWNKKHSAGEHNWFADMPNPLAQKMIAKLNGGERILEIGCGNGRDSRYLAMNGYVVVATDFSEVAVAKSAETNNYSNLQFSVLDVREQLPFSNGEFDVVYSSLALHYFTDEMTKDIFREIHRVLKSSGLFVFGCKSYDELRMKEAKVIEKDIYVDPNGHVLHAFSMDFVRELVDGLFEIISLEEKDEPYGGRVSTVVSCIARKA